ncbi:MAG: hypothetical protein ABEJ91_01850 [Candidatus Nanohaloarchaea archaeon]
MEDFELRDKDVGELDDLREEEYPPQEFAGEKVPALEVDTAIEHLDRSGEEYSAIRNEDDGVRVKADLGSGHFLEVFNGHDAETGIRLGSEKGYGADSHYDSRFRTLVQREKKSRKAAEWAVNRMEEEGDVWEVFRDQLDGRGFEQMAVDNFREGLSFDAVTVPYNYLFELKPWQDIDSDRVREYEGEMPNAEYQDEVSKYHYWFTKYLSNIAELAAHRAGEVDQEIGRMWLEDSPKAGNPA